jgi:hypothetical protein
VTVTPTAPRTTQCDAVLGTARLTRFACVRPHHLMFFFLLLFY